MLNEKEWAEHIIGKFGKDRAMRYAVDKEHSCPCSSLRRKCLVCIFNTGYYHDNHMGCCDAYNFSTFLGKRNILPINDMVNEIKKHIREIIKDNHYKELEKQLEDNFF